MAHQLQRSWRQLFLIAYDMGIENTALSGDAPSSWTSPGRRTGYDRPRDSRHGTASSRPASRSLALSGEPRRLVPARASEQFIQRRH